MHSPISFFSGLRDPRVERTKAHLLGDILFIAISSVICGAETWNDMEDFGKSIRGSRGRDGKSIVHMVSAWAGKNNIALGQVKANDKSNEIAAIPELLNLLVLKGCVVTIDAMGCQKGIQQPASRCRSFESVYTVSLGNRELARP